jgi:asparagine synthase (glutamine-hydrolysing)
MCGIFGSLHSFDYDFSDHDFRSLLKKIDRRGPDNTGISHHNLESGILKLGHTRLSILDLNPSGHQPMESMSKRFSIIFNGEIYNHLEIRKELEQQYSIEWRGTSDTETLLALLESESLTTSLNKLEGMFSFLLFDKKRNELIIARDHSGEKPLYISTSNNYLSFASDLNPLKGLPGFNNSINKRAVEQYLQLNYIPNPHSIYNSSFKLPPASSVIIELNKYKFADHHDFQSFISANGVSFFKWWSLDGLTGGKNPNIKLDDGQVESELSELLEKSVKSQLISDVPLGAFLSGGIDSSIVVAMMQKAKGTTKTYTVGFNFTDFDESIYAKKVSEHLGTDHTNYICEEKDFFELIESLPKAYSEPFADSSQLPTMLVSKLASRDVKVALSGDAGDEIFGGYNRYILANKYWKIIKLIPLPLRELFLSLIATVPKKTLQGVLERLPVLNNFSGSKADRLEKILIKLAGISNKESFYKSMTTEWSPKSNIMEFSSKSEREFNNLFSQSNLSFEEAMMHADFTTYLPDDILCKVDRSSMFYGLETRAPFLNRKVIEYAYKLPLHYKIRNGSSKWILRKILHNYIPAELFERPKQGFGIPVSKWMRGDLKPWVNDMLSDDLLNKHDLFNNKAVKDIKEQHFNGSVNNEHKLWSLLQFNQWYQENHN